MSYAALGAVRADDTRVEATLRAQATRYAVRMWNDYQALLRTGTVRELMATEPYSSSAFAAAYRRVRRAASSRLDTRVSKREFASMLQAAMAKLTTLQIKARMLARAADIQSAYPVVERVNAAAMRLLGSVQQMLSRAQPIRKEATSGLKGDPGLGFIMAVVLIGAFVIPAVLALVYSESMHDADIANRQADEWCARQQRVTGRPCTGDERQAAYREAIRLREESGVRGLVRDAGRGTAEAFEDVTGGAIGEGIGSGFKWAMITGAVAVAGLGFYAAWPYVTGVRQVGQRATRRAERAAQLQEGYDR